MRINGQVVELPATIGKAIDNAVVLDATDARPHHAILVELGQQTVLMTRGLTDTVGGRPILGGLYALTAEKTAVRLAGVKLTLERSSGGWVKSVTTDADLHCAVCKLTLEIGEPIWRCCRCGVPVHESAFCQPATSSTNCFRCGGFS